MDRRTLTLAVGVVLFAGAAMTLAVPVVTAIELSALVLAVVGIGLFTGVYLIGMSHPGAPS